MKPLQHIIQIALVYLTFNYAEEICFGDEDQIGTCMTSLKCLMKQGKYLGLCDPYNNDNSVCCYLEEEIYAYDNYIVEEHVEETYVEVDDECNIIRTKDMPRRFKRVVGGYLAYDSHHPWSVAIWTKDNDICGGTLLKNGWILTAAHCLEDIPLSNFEIGIYNPRWENRTYYQPEQAISHHLYDFSRNLYVDDFYYDVALIKVALPEEVLADLEPACVSPTQDIDNLDVKVWGWGQIGNETFPEGLQELDLFVFPNEECYYVQCSNNESECVNFNGDLMFCAGVDRETAGKDTCKGDSGGGVIVGNKAVVGIVSWGVNAGCGLQDRPGVYQRVLPVYDWIQDIIANDGNSSVMLQMKQIISAWVAGAVDSISKNVLNRIISGLGRI